MSDNLSRWSEASYNVNDTAMAFHCIIKRKKWAKKYRIQEYAENVVKWKQMKNKSILYSYTQAILTLFVWAHVSTSRQPESVHTTYLCQIVIYDNDEFWSYARFFVRDTCSLYLVFPTFRLTIGASWWILLLFLLTRIWFSISRFWVQSSHPKCLCLPHKMNYVSHSFFHTAKCVAYRLCFLF